MAERHRQTHRKRLRSRCGSRAYDIGGFVGMVAVEERGGAISYRGRDRRDNHSECHRQEKLAQRPKPAQSVKILPSDIRNREVIDSTGRKETWKF